MPNGPFIAAGKLSVFTFSEFFHVRVGYTDVVIFKACHSSMHLVL